MSSRTVVFAACLVALCMALLVSAPSVQALEAGTAGGGQQASASTTSAASTTGSASDIDASTTTATASVTSGYGINGYTLVSGKMRRQIDGVDYYGMKIPEASLGGMIVVVNDAYALIYNPVSLDSFEGEAGAGAWQSFCAMLAEKNDAQSSSNLSLMADKVQNFFFTSEHVYTLGEYTYYFDRDVDGSPYVLCNSTQGIDFMGFGFIVPADEVIDESTTLWQDVVTFFKDLDYRPLWISLKTGITSMVFIFILGLYVAWRTMRCGARAKGIIDTIFTLPMVMPPTVVGFFLLVVFGSSTALGRWFIEHGLRLVFSWPATVIAATVVALPLMYRTVRGAFESLDQNMLACARTLGFSERKVFWRLMLPLAWPSIAAGTVLAFARAMGEFGATLFVAGNLPGITQTMPIAVYFAWMGGDLLVAGFWVLVIIIISFLVILFINVYSHKVEKKQAGLMK